MEIVFNIETDALPRDEILHLMPEFTAPSNYKDAEKIQVYKTKKQDEWLLDAPMSALSGRVLAIGVQEPTKNVLSFLNNNEADLLRNFWEYYRRNTQCKFVGFNCNSFVIPFLVRRSWANRVQIPNIFHGRYLSGNFIDLAQVWSCGTYEKVSLEHLARFFGIKIKNPDVKFNAMWEINPLSALEKLKSDVMAIRYIGEAMNVIEEEF